MNYARPRTGKPLCCCYHRTGGPRRRFHSIDPMYPRDYERWP